MAQLQETRAGSGVLAIDSLGDLARRRSDAKTAMRSASSAPAFHSRGENSVASASRLPNIEMQDAPRGIASIAARLDAREMPSAHRDRRPIRRKTRREDSASTSFDSGFTPLRDNFTAFRDKNTQFNPTQLQFHSTFGCDFHRIECVSSAQGV